MTRTCRRWSNLVEMFRLLGGDRFGDTLAIIPPFLEDPPASWKRGVFLSSLHPF